MHRLDPALARSLADLLGPDRFRTDEPARQQFGRDWTRFAPANPSAVALPDTAAEVQAIVQLAGEHGCPLVPSGGRTGLSGGAVAAQGELVVALDRMAAILECNPTGRRLVCEAGATTGAIQQAARDHGLMYPVDFASSGSSQIGGNVATNAGGIQVIRNGMTRDWVTGLKVVSGRGELLDLNGGLLKNNTGLDLRHLMIGSEGVLGIIVEATLALTTPPGDPRVMVLGVPSMEAVMAVLDLCRSQLDVLAFELFSEGSLDKVVAHKGLQAPLSEAQPWYVLMEFDAADSATELAFDVVERGMTAGWISDAVVSQSEQQRRALWRLREEISETLSQWTPYKNDISTTVDQVPALQETLDCIVTRRYPEFEVIWYGHVGDGNLHLNVLKPDNLSIADFQSRCHEVSEEIFAAVADLGGSISAEHGVGLLKKPFLHHSRSASELALMKGIKALLDPRGILNPGKVFD